VRRDQVEMVSIPAWAPEEEFGLRFRGYFSAPEDGVYAFRVGSDDGAVVRFGGATVLDHDGPHGATDKQAEVALARGLHPLEVLYFQGSGARSLQVEWAGPDGVWKPLDASVVSRVR